MASNDLVDAITASAASEITPPEAVVAAVRANAPRSLSKAVANAGAGAAGVVTGAVGMALTQARSASSPVDTMLGAALPADLALGLTQRQLLVCARGGLLGKVKSLVTAVPLRRIRDVQTGTMKISGVTVAVMGVTFDDGTTTAVTFAKPDTAAGETFASRLSAAVRPDQS